MGSLGGYLYGKDVRMPVAVALLILAVAAWKASRDDLKTSRGPDRPRTLEGEPPASSERKREPHGSANGSSSGEIQGNGDGQNTAETTTASTPGRGATNCGTTDAAPGALPQRGRKYQRAEYQYGRAREGAAAAVAAGGSSAGAVAASKQAVSGITVVSTTTLRRMCFFPGAILRSGLVFQRVTALSLPGQGIGDGDIPRSVAGLAGFLRKVDISRNRLTTVPRGLLELGNALEELNLGNNEIMDLPPEIANLNGMLFFNMAGNRLKRIPPEIGRLSALRRLGLKGNALVGLPSSIGDLSHLVELYLTGNILEALPSEIVKLRRLKKLQMSFNNLCSLPIGMEGMRSLELCRMAVNPGLAEVPEGLVYAERLSWVSLGGTAWCARAAEKRRRSSFPIISREDVVLGERLGRGASGDVYAAVYRGQDVAVKAFKSDVSPDGNARDELDVACAVNHPNLTKAIGIVCVKNSRSGGGAGAASDDCSINNKQWLVMERVEGQPLADRPDFTSVLRCRWGAGRRFEPVLVLAVLLQVARALSYLHEKRICHGDLYAHNVLVDGKTGTTVLCDFGASFFYQNVSESHGRKGFALEGTEVRAFGIMARDMACRSVGCEWILQDLVPSCLQADTALRPSFHEIINQLHAELMQSVEPSSPMVTSAKSLHSLLDRPDIAAERGRMLSAESYQELLSRPSVQRSATEAMVSGCEGPESAMAAAAAAQVGATGEGVNAPRMEDAIASDQRGASDGREWNMCRGSGRRGRGSMSGSKPVCRLGGVQEGTTDDEAGEEEKAQEKGGKAEGKGFVTFK